MRGKSYSLCELSKVDRRFPKYPRVPVFACSGYQAKDESVVSVRDEPNDPVKA